MLVGKAESVVDRSREADVSVQSCETSRRCNGHRLLSSCVSHFLFQLMRCLYLYLRFKYCIPLIRAILHSGCSSWNASNFSFASPIHFPLIS